MAKKATPGSLRCPSEFETQRIENQFVSGRELFRALIQSCVVLSTTVLAIPRIQHLIPCTGAIIRGASTFRGNARLLLHRGATLTGEQHFMATQMSAYTSLDSKHTGIRVALCEPDPAIRAQVCAAVDGDQLLILAAESQNWNECEACLDSVVPELLIVRSELIPADWNSRSSDHFLPVVVPLQTTLTFPNSQRNDLHVPADPQTIKATLDRAVRDIYDRKAKQLLFLVDRYVAGSQSLATYKTFIQVESEGRLIDVPVDSILSIIAARKHVSINSSHGRYFLREPIHRVIGRLDPTLFVRIHRSIVVNIRHVDRTLTPAIKPFAVVLSNGSRY